MTKRGNHIAIMAILAAVLAMNAVPPCVAFADEVDNALDRYEELLGRVESVQGEIDGIAARRDETEASISRTREALASETEWRYRLGFCGFSEMSAIGAVLDSAGLPDAMRGLMYSEKISDMSAGTIRDLSALRDELDVQHNELMESMVAAQEAANAAQREYAEAKERQEREREAAEAAERAAYAAANAAPSLPAVDWNVTEEEFVAEWAPRIDEYLGSAPLGGYGEDFARAAYRYGVDPRWSPAISCIESTKGEYCFASYNAWGFMGHSFSSWSEGIWTHVEYLACDYYHGQCTLQAARTYCPPTYVQWYELCISEMASI